MDLFDVVLIGAAFGALALVPFVIVLLANGSSRDKRQGGKLLDARMREGYTYANPQRTAARTLTFSDPEAVYAHWDCCKPDHTGLGA